MARSFSAWYVGCCCQVEKKFGALESISGQTFYMCMQNVMNLRKKLEPDF